MKLLRHILCSTEQIKSHGFDNMMTEGSFLGDFSDDSIAEKIISPNIYLDIIRHAVIIAVVCVVSAGFLWPGRTSVGNGWPP